MDRAVAGAVPPSHAAKGRLEGFWPARQTPSPGFVAPAFQRGVEDGPRGKFASLCIGGKGFRRGAQPQITPISPHASVRRTTFHLELFALPRQRKRRPLRAVRRTQVLLCNRVMERCRETEALTCHGACPGHRFSATGSEELFRAQFARTLHDEPCRFDCFIHPPKESGGGSASTRSYRGGLMAIGVAQDVTQSNGIRSANATPSVGGLRGITTGNRDALMRWSRKNTGCGIFNREAATRRSGG